MNYFDHAASSVIYPEVLDVLSQTMKDDFANPGAKHILGQNLQEKIENFREDFLKAIGAKKNDSFIFTSSATESNNTVIRGLSLREGDVVLYSKADHPSVTAPVEFLAAQFNVTLKEISLDSSANIDIESFSLSLNENVKLVVLTHVNNQTGVVSDIEAIAKIVKEKSKAHVHVDAVQSFTKINFKLSSDIDSMSFTSHKIGGPKGIAGLFLKQNHKVLPLLLGGGHEYGMRSGTLSYPLIAGFHKAMNISMENSAQSFSQASQFSEMIMAKFSQEISTIQFTFKSTSPYIVSFVLPGISSDIILRHLETKDVYIASSSACSSRISGFNPSLLAMNIPEKFHKNFLRISLGSLTTEKEVEVLIREFLDVWENLKHMRGR